MTKSAVAATAKAAPASTPEPEVVSHPEQLWSYIIMYKDGRGGIAVKEVACPYVDGPTREKAMIKLCFASGINPELFIGALESSPSVRVRFSHDGAIIRFSV